MHKRKAEKTEKINGDEDSTKRTRYEENPPSRVVHLRGLPSDITENEIAAVAVPFGLIHYMVVTKKTGQALIEMENTEVAEAMYSYYQIHPPHIRNKRNFLQYSIHNSLQAPNTHMHPDAENSVNQANQACEAMAKEKGGRVLRFMIDDWNRESINSLHVYKMFQHYGEIEKIVVYVNRGVLQGFLQYAEAFSSKVAKAIVNGICVYPNCCSIKVYFSNRETLDIGKEDDMVRDFVQHPLVADELKHIHVNMGGSMPKHAEVPRERGDPIEALAALQPMLSRAARHPEDAMPLLRSLAPAIRGFLDSGSSGRERGNDNRFGDAASPLLIVSNLNEAKANPDALFKLFGHYGDVVRVKIMYNRKNTALVQFVNEEHASRALHFLNGVYLYGKPLHINFSKHDRINNRAPEPGSEEDKSSVVLHKDYSDSRLHRFRKKSSKNHANIYEPGKVLHIAGLVNEASEEDIEEMFSEHDFKVEKIKIFEVNNSKMALVEINSVDTAVEALIELHDYDLGGSHLRVSFSKGHLK